jgi:hypothetical protein
MFLRFWKQVVLWSSSMRTSELAKLRWEDRDAASNGTTWHLAPGTSILPIPSSHAWQDLNGAVSSSDFFDYMAESSERRSRVEARQRVFTNWPSAK